MTNQKTIIITGASHGIGAAAARLLKSQGHHVIIVGRSAKNTKRVAKEIDAPYYVADFSSLKEIRELAANLLRDVPRIDVLANNAGAIMGNRKLTTDGFEQTFQINHLAPFLLTTLLMDRLIESQAAIINTSSVANKLLSRFDIDNLNSEKNYSPNQAYGNAKLANILFTKELHQRYHHAGIATAAFHPGNVATGFSNGSTSILRFLYQTPLNHLLLTPEKGADTLVWLASTQPDLDWTSGEYYEKRKISKAHEQAYDDELARKLWKASALLVKKR